MKNSMIKISALVLLIVIPVSVSFAQFNVLKRAQQKVERKLENKADDAIDDAIDDAFGDGNNSNSGNQQGNYPSNQGNSSSNPSSGNNSGSSGNAMNMSAPDVIENINDAQSSLSAKNYSNTRFAIQQALVGIEIEMGKEVLKSLPTNLSGMGFNESQDQVYSTSFGFVGLSIKRSYGSGNNTGEVGILNNSGMLASYNMILTNPSYTSNSDNNYKVVKINSYRAVIESRDNGHFNVGIPFGQSSVFILDLNGFNSEAQVISAAEQFDIDKIKKILGEQ